MTMFQWYFRKVKVLAGADERFPWTLGVSDPDSFPGFHGETPDPHLALGSWEPLDLLHLVDVLEAASRVFGCCDRGLKTPREMPEGHLRPECCLYVFWR